MTTPSERAHMAAGELYDRLRRSSGPSRDIALMAAALDAFAAEAVRAESGLTWVAAEMLVALVARDVERLHDGDFKLGMEFACEEILERMKAGPDSVQTTQATDKLRARTPASGEECKYATGGICLTHGEWSALCKAPRP